MRRARGQAAIEFVLCAGLLAAAVFLPLVDGMSASTLLVRRMTEFFRGFYALLALA
jgi:hypothetical protein